MKKNKYWLGAILAIILLTAMTIPTAKWMTSNNKTMSQRRQSKMTPLIMIPGSSATANRFDGLIKILNKTKDQKHSVLRITVNENNTMTFDGSISKGDEEPIIVVGFKNNSDGYTNIKRQADWFDQAFYQIMQDFHFHKFKAFGHSNGGLVWTYWLEHYYSSYSSEIKVTKLMTLGSPYNFKETSYTMKTQMFSDFLKYKKNLPKSLIVYSLLGGKTYTSDGLVPEGSVLAGKYIFQNQVKNYMSINVTGTDAQHSKLVENPQVVKLIKEYLLKNNNRRDLMRKGPRN
ncbi:MAG: alpha/beta hydrolase [Lactobacillus sp.]|nr:alpha/beta hydrolase [Lactobacillus sp.]